MAVKVYLFNLVLLYDPAYSIVKDLPRYYTKIPCRS